jgi:pyruvate/2-oxoacid:ferredoxin oxidoreductase beta subunit
MTTDSYEFAKSFIADLMVANPKIAIHKVYTNLKDAGFVKATKPYTKDDVRNMMEEVRNEWASEQMETRHQARERQLREIQLIKAKLHERGDYKTLERYLRIEKDLLGTDIADEREDRKLELEASTRIRALELARQQEQLILQQESTVEEINYLEVIDE